VMSTAIRFGLTLGLVSAGRIFALMIVVPILHFYQTIYATDAIGIGWAIGIYGLTQALLQLPMGFLSDRYGRRNIILLALGLFAVTSLLQGLIVNIWVLTLLRALQGAAAINGVMTAYAIDLVPEKNRALTLAIIGMMIGMAFFLAMILGPLLNEWFGLFNLFFGLSALMVLLYLWVRFKLPVIVMQPQPWQTKPFKQLQFWVVGLMGGLIHGVFTATFSVIPQMLLKTYTKDAMLYEIYLPSIVLAVILAFVIIRRIGKDAPIFWVAASLASMLCGLWVMKSSMLLCMILFISGFSVLEASLPLCLLTLDGITAKGSLMGGYFSCVQFGVFVVNVMAGYSQAWFAVSDAVLRLNINLLAFGLIIWGLFFYFKKCHSK
jgi:MFS family permease